MLLHLRPAEGDGSPRVKNGPPLNGTVPTAVRTRRRDDQDLPEQLRRSLTWDQSVEMAETRNSGSIPACRSTPAIDAARGSAHQENTNGLLRQYFPEGNRPW